ncbi:MAG: F0F1 ATP synthase subunit alpha [Alphaproteobacteria bacterium]|nr:F0F1 ATP synthase subunit alpha [Alphaproteobacteria bacterium]
MRQAEDWLERARGKLASTRLGPRVDEFGRVESVADGVAFVSGLPHARLDELVRFDCGVSGFVQTLETDAVSVVLLDESERLEAGDIARGTGAVIQTPVGEALLGRIVDPLGRPLDGGETLDNAPRWPIERPAPEIIARDNVIHPVQTGILSIDALFPLGRGQRELIIGDRSTGKTAVAVDCIINQKASDIVSVYVAIGQKSSAVKRAIDAVREYGAFERSIFVVAAASAAPGLRWIAPYAGFTIGEYFRDRGGHALVVLDDLTKHAATHRELALLTRQPPGREAYPGDVFHIHARLLERATRLSEHRGAGSLTALPIAETDAGNLSAYIPTNLISITDGQIVLDSKLFREGQKPAVDIGKSVSRVGGKTQAPALRNAAESLRLDYAQFLELEIFTRFGGVTDERVKSRVERGKRLRELLTQPQYAPLDLPGEVALVLAVQNGLLDSVPVERIADFRAGISDWLREAAPEIEKALTEKGQLTTDERKSLLAILAQRAAQFSESASA